MMAQDEISKKVSYDLYVQDITVNYTGKSKPAPAKNGQIPRLREGRSCTIETIDVKNIYVGQGKKM